MASVYRASALVLLALAGTAFATPDEPINLPLKQVTVAPQGTYFLPRSEVNQLVYEVPSPSDLPGNNFGSGGSAAIINDAAFPSFPPAQGVTYPIPVNGLTFGWVAFGPAHPTPGNFDYQITFFDNLDPASPDPFYNTVIGTFRQNNIAPSWGFVQWFQDPLALVDGVGNPVTINFPDQNWAYEIKCFRTGTNNLWVGNPSATSVSMIVPFHKLVVGTGSSDPRYWFNLPADSDASGGVNQAILVANFRGTVAGPRHAYLKLRADIPAVPAPGAIDFVTGAAVVGDPTAFDCNSNGGTLSRSFELVPGQSQFFGFSVAGTGVSVDSDTYMQITTSTDFADTTMALYDVGGNRISLNDDDGDLLNPQLTYGRALWTVSGDSAMLDGRNGDLAPGNYYLCVSGFGTTFGASGFTNNPAAHVESGNCTVTINSNVGDGEGVANCPLPSPVAPIAPSQGLLADGVTTVQVAEVGFGQVRWITFDIDYSVSPGDTTQFLDINTAGSDAVVDSEIGVYDSLGNRIADNDDACNGGSGVQSLLSFSDINATPRPGIGACGATGQSGDTLPAGTYYLCVGLFDTDYRDTGWQARSDSGSRLTVNINFRTPAGCAADFNADGNVDPDDLGDFINCYFGEQSFPGSCPAADFNGDTSIDPDDLGDFINLYFAVQAGQPCV